MDIGQLNWPIGLIGVLKTSAKDEIELSPLGLFVDWFEHSLCYCHKSVIIIDEGALIQLRMAIFRSRSYLIRRVTSS